MRRVIVNRQFWLLCLGAVAINLILMYGPDTYHSIALVAWTGLAIWASIHLRRAFKATGEVAMHGILIGIVLVISTLESSRFLLLNGYGSFDNVEYANLHSNRHALGICWGSHGPTSCD